MEPGLRDHHHLPVLELLVVVELVHHVHHRHVSEDHRRGHPAISGEELLRHPDVRTAQELEGRPDVGPGLLEPDWGHLAPAGLREVAAAGHRAPRGLADRLDQPGHFLVQSLVQNLLPELHPEQRVPSPVVVPHEPPGAAPDLRQDLLESGPALRVEGGNLARDLRRGQPGAAPTLLVL